MLRSPSLSPSCMASAASALGATDAHRAANGRSTEVARHQGRASHAHRAADRLHRHPRRGRRRGRRRVAARRRAGHARDRSARSRQHGGQGATPSCCPAAAPTGSTPRRAWCAISRRRNIGWKVGRRASCRSCRRRSCSTCAFGGKPKIRPTADCGYKAAQAATDGPVAKATSARARARRSARWAVGRSMKAGIGSAAIALPNGLVVAAIVAVNAVGDIIDPDDRPGRRRRAQPKTARRSPTCARCCEAARLIAPAAAARGREHDDRPRRHQREADQGARSTGGA